MIYILVPVFNEEENISPLVSNIDFTLRKIGEEYRLVFINDGSTDKTAEAIHNHMELYPLEILENIPNQGVGASFEKGFKYFTEKGNNRDVLITMEGDNTCDLTILPKMIHIVREGKDFALASCYAKGGKLKNCPLERKFFSMAANWLCKILFHIKGVHTYSSFYRAFSHLTIHRLYSLYNNNVIKENGFTCMVELLLKLHHAGFGFTEVPCTLFFKNRRGSSKLKKRKTIKSYLQLFFSYFFQENYFPKP